MDYKEIIALSWYYTQENKGLIRWYGFLPALFTTTFGVGYILYQIFAFKNSWLFEDAEESFLHQVITFIWDFVKVHLSWTLPLVIIIIIAAIVYFLLPTLAKASAIQVIARNKNSQKTSLGNGLRHGIMSFLPLLEYHMLIKTFAFFAVLMEMSFVLRSLGPVIFNFMLPAFLIFMCISLLLTLLFTYADFYIVIDDKGVFEAMRLSAKLVINHWQSTFLVTILMLIIGIRIVIQAFMVFLIPTLIIIVSGYVAMATLPVTGVIIGLIIGGIGLIVAAYLNGIVDIFSYTVWTYTFLDLTSEKELSAREVASARDRIDHDGEPSIVDGEDVPKRPF